MVTTSSVEAVRPEPTTFEEFVRDKARVDAVMNDVYAKGDTMMRRLVLLHLGITLVLAPFYSTWFLSLTIGGAAAAMFFTSVALLPRHRVTRMIAGITLQTFVAVHIYQLHGLPEMHFFFFTAFTAMVVYQDGLSMWPGTALIIGQHILFAVLQNSGVNLYFFPDSYIGVFKLFWHFGIAILQVVLCGWWAVSLRQQALLDAFQRDRLRAAQVQLERDMNARVEAERALAAHEAEARLAIVANHTSNGVVIADPEGRIEWVNPAFERLAACSAAEARGRTRAELLLGMDADPALVDELTKGLETGDEVSVEIPMRAGGEVEWLYIQMKRVRGPGGAVERIIGVEVDVTARKKSEAEVLAARARAEEASRAKGDFLATMSHEMRTPLNGILGMSDMLARGGDLNGKQAEQLETLRTCADNLLALVNDVLDLSKIDAGKLEITKHAFEPRLMVDDVLAMNAVRAQSKGIELVAIVDRTVPDVLVGDMARTRQTLTNLVTNGVKFTGRGEVEVRVELVRDPSGGDARRVRFTVRDTGIGVDAETQQRLFTPFTQADGTISRRFGGSGLGLAISKRLVEAMGGSIGLESVPGRGSSFYFELPCDRGKPSRPPSSFAGRTARVESKHEGTRHALVELLAARGVTVLAAGARQAPDVLVLDSALPAEKVASLAAAAGPGRVVVLARAGGAPVPDDAVTLTWPVRHAALENALVRILDPDRAAAHPAERGLAWNGAAGKRVLLVEDNPINQVVAQSILEDLGVEVTIAEDGESGLAAMRASRFDLVLMDCQMPVLDGFEATRRFRATETGPRLPIVALTAQALAGDEGRCKEAGMDDYLSKPVDRRSLVAKLELFLAPREAETPSRRPPSAEAVGSPSGGDVEEIRAFLGTFEQELGKGAVERLLATFTTSIPAQIAKLRAAAGFGTAGSPPPDGPESLARVAHSLKGAARSVGLGALGGRIHELEMLSGADARRARMVAEEVEARLDAVVRAVGKRAKGVPA